MLSWPGPVLVVVVQYRLVHALFVVHSHPALYPITMVIGWRTRGANVVYVDRQNKFVEALLVERETRWKIVLTNGPFFGETQ